MVERGIAVSAIILRSVVRPSVAALLLQFLLEILFFVGSGFVLDFLPPASINVSQTQPATRAK